MKNFALLSLALLSGALFAGGPFGRFSNGTPRPFNTSQPMIFAIEAGDLTTFFTNSVAGELVRQNFELWNQVPGSRLQIVEGPPLPNDITNADGISDALSRGISPIVFDEDGAIASEFGATGAAAFAGPAGIPNLPYDRMFAVIIGPASIGRTEESVGSIMLHEFGHGLGLGHSQVNGYLFANAINYQQFGRPPQDSVEVMYWQAVAPNTQLQVDDISAFLALHGNTPLGAAGFGGVAGQVLLPNFATPADGINVIVRQRSADNNSVFYNAASIITAPVGYGDYRIVGLPPGEYSIEVADAGWRHTGRYSDPIRTNFQNNPTTRLGPFPGDAEFFNGGNESNNPLIDDPSEVTQVLVAADTVSAGVDLVFNREPDLKGTLLTNIYYVPEIHVEGEQETFIGVINPDTQLPVNIDVYGFSQLGEEIGRGQIDTRLGPLSKTMFGIKEAFPTNFSDVAWVQVGGTGALHVFAELNRPNSKSAFWAAPRLETEAFMPHVAKNTTGFSTFLATVNGKEGSVDTSLTSMPTGTNVSVPEHTVGFSKAKSDVRELFGDDLSDVDWVQIQSTGAGAGLGSASMEYFVVLPNETQVASLGLDNQSGTILRFLHVAKDVTQFWTGLVYMNAGNATANVTETYYRDDGTVITTRDLQLEAGSKINPIPLFDENNTEPLGTAWMSVSGDQPLVGYELFGSPISSGHDYFAGLQGNYAQGGTLDYPHVISSPITFTGLVALNVGDVSGDVIFTAYDSLGVALESTTPETIAPKTKKTVLARSLFSPETIAETAWIRATTSDSEWSGFVLWGDTGVGQRQLLAGINSPLRLRVTPPDEIDPPIIVMEEEDNNSYETAQVLTKTGDNWNINVIGSVNQLEANTPVDADGDDVEDLYQITLTEATALLIAISPDTALHDLDLFVTDTANFTIDAAVLDQNQNNPNFDWSAYGLGDESIARVFQPGTYYILVSSWDSNQNPIQISDYGLLVSSVPLLLETFDGVDALEDWQVATFADDTDGMASWNIMPDFLETKFNDGLVSLSPANGVESSFLTTSTFAIPEGGLTVMDADAALLINSPGINPGSFAYGLAEWPGNGQIQVLTLDPSTPTSPVTFNGGTFQTPGWQPWASAVPDRSFSTFPAAPGSTVNLAIGAQHPASFHIFDNVRAYNLKTTMGGTKRAQNQVVLARSGPSYHEKVQQHKSLQGAARILGKKIVDQNPTKLRLGSPQN